ncbi:MAG: GNAT family N-acetyltransferase [Actinomycetota bacterium]|nr:GNAT family N-acetyltransferase [Actinomycetota bacterium]
MVEHVPVMRVRRLSEVPSLRPDGVALVDGYLRLADAWGGEVPDVLPPVLQRVVAGFPGDALPPEGEVLVAEVDGAPVGQVLLVPHSPGVGRLERMYIVEPRRRQGLGQLLLEEALAVASSTSATGSPPSSPTPATTGRCSSSGETFRRDPRCHTPPSY